MPHWILIFALPGNNLETAFDNFACCVDHERQAAAVVKEREAITPRISIDAALAAARDLSLPHEGLNVLRAEAEALRDQRGVHTERLAIEVDPASFLIHRGPLVLLRWLGVLHDRSTAALIYINTGNTNTAEQSAAAQRAQSIIESAVARQLDGDPSRGDR